MEPEPEKGEVNAEEDAKDQKDILEGATADAIVIEKSSDYGGGSIGSIRNA